MRSILACFYLLTSLLIVGCSRSDEKPELVLQFGHTGLVTALAFSPDEKTLASAGTDNTMRLWDPKTGEAKNAMPDKYANIQRLEYSPDGAYLVARSGDNAMYRGGEVVVWEAGTYKVVRIWHNAFREVTEYLRHRHLQSSSHLAHTQQRQFR